MATVLFVDACARGWEVSYTYAVAKAFTDSYLRQNPADTVEELNLAEEHLACFTGQMLDKRNRLLRDSSLNDPFFSLARQFAKADKILIAAPYWDLSFPALLKIYIEHICVNGIAFRYGTQGEEIGLCKAQKLLFITTSGGTFTSEEMDMRGTGLTYLKAICSMLGIPQFESLWTQGMDLVGNDRQLLLLEASENAAAFAQNW